MANLSIRKLDDAIYEQLQIRAAEHAVSMEEEVRQILCQAVAAPKCISNIFTQCFGSQNGVDLSELLQHKPHNPMDFTE